MSQFRSYLDQRGSVISQNQDLASYFALPYIPDPSKHPSFQNIFLVSNGEGEGWGICPLDADAS